MTEQRAGQPDAAKIGPVATHLLLENGDVNIWQVDTGPGEAFWPHYHNYDYVLFQTTEILGVVYDPSDEHERVWTSRSDSGDTVRAATRDDTMGSLMPAHGVNYIPGTGFLSPGYINIGTQAFTAALIEVKRPRRSDQEGIGYSRSDALAGLPPRPGCVHLLENDRVRVYETVLEPGARDEARPHLDSAVYVIDGGVIEIAESDDTGDTVVFSDERPSISARWLKGGVRRQLRNIGTTTYRELSVELK